MRSQLGEAKALWREGAGAHRHRSPLLRQVLAEIAATLQRWRQRARYRRDLARLRRTSPHLIDDIGLSQAAADREATTPFWRL